MQNTRKHRLFTQLPKNYHNRITRIKPITNKSPDSSPNKNIILTLTLNNLSLQLKQPSITQPNPEQDNLIKIILQPSQYKKDNKNNARSIKTKDEENKDS